MLGSAVYRRLNTRAIRIILGEKRYSFFIMGATIRLHELVVKPIIKFMPTYREAMFLYGFANLWLSPIKNPHISVEVFYLRTQYETELGALEER